METATTVPTRERLVTAATEVFMREGYHAATLRDVAARAGLTTGAVYSRFGSKGDLFLAAYDAFLERRTAEMVATAQAADVARTAGDQWVERLERERGWHLAVLEFRAFAARDPRLGPAFAERIRGLLAGVRLAYDPDGRDTPEAGRARLANADGYMLQILAGAEPVTGEEIGRAGAAAAAAVRGWS